MPTSDASGDRIASDSLRGSHTEARQRAGATRARVPWDGAPVINAEVLLRSVVGEPLATVTGKPNTVLAVADGEALVATGRSPQGRPIPITWLQDVLDRLAGGETITAEATAGEYRSAFLRAVLATLPQVEFVEAIPPAVRVDPTANTASDVRAEFEHRLGMWVALLDEQGPERVAPSVLRLLGIYGGASGIWADAARTRGIGGADSIAVGLLHTGRHYPDDLSDDALLYHYPVTDRPPGRDAAEVRAMKAAGDLRLPVFVVLQEGALRTVRKGWVATWDDDEQVALIEFGAAAVRVPSGDTVDAEPFELFEDQRRVIRRTRGRANQQRFKVQVIQRYGGASAFCRCPDQSAREALGVRSCAAPAAGWFPLLAAGRPWIARGSPSFLRPRWKRPAFSPPAWRAPVAAIGQADGTGKSGGTAAGSRRRRK